MVIKWWIEIRMRRGVWGGRGKERRVGEGVKDEWQELEQELEHGCQTRK